MKNIIILVSILMCLTSCEKYLEVKPTNVLAVSTYDDIKALMGAYIRTFGNTSTLTGTSLPYMNNNYYLIFGLYGDELDYSRFLGNMWGRNQRTLHTRCYSWRHPSTPGNFWSSYFTNIGFLNTIIDELDEVSASKEEKDIVRYEAKFLRAWYLFKLAQYYSPYKAEDWGIPFNFDSQLVGSYDKRRKTQKEVYNTIISELKEIIECETPPRESYNLFFDKRLANALLAQVYHYKGDSRGAEDGDYDNAILYATAALEGKEVQSIDEYAPFHTFEVGVYGVYKNLEQAMFVTNKYKYVDETGMYAITVSGNQKQFATEAAYSLYKDNDVRKELFFDDDMSITKYNKVTSRGAYTLLIFNFFHYADMHLIIAESYARNGDSGNAKQWLESFQRKRYRNYTGFSGTDVLQEIMDERRREFFLEHDMRWIDMTRTQKGWSRFDYIIEDEPITDYTLEDDDYRFCFPIPVDEELQYNKIQQNPGWDSSF